MNTLTLFAGAGGADIGLKAAGCHHIECVEGDANAVYTLIAAGFPGVHGWVGDVPDGNNTPQWIWNGQPVDLLWCSPPCQPFSNAGLRLGIADNRNGWPATFGIIQRIKPHYVIVENVGGAPVQEWAEQLRTLYRYVEARFIDAVDWGLPSHRHRWIIIAGNTPVKWPQQTHYGPEVPWIVRRNLQPWNSIGAALKLDPATRYYPMGTTSTFARAGGYDVAHPCTAITTRGNHYIITPDGQRRKLTWQECAILMGFPADYPFQGNIGQHYKQIGNAVAPIMAEVIGRAVIEALKSQ